jgi:hypothetical protein
VPRTDGRSAARRPALIPTAALRLGAVLVPFGCLVAGCADLAASNASDVHSAAPAASPSSAAADPKGDPGCAAALKAISTYGPSSVKLLAEGREAVNQAGVRLLVDALDTAASAADQPAIGQDIRTLAEAYDGFFDLSTDAFSVPLSTVLKDTVDLEGLCRE